MLRVIFISVVCAFLVIGMFSNKALGHDLKSKPKRDVFILNGIILQWQSGDTLLLRVWDQTFGEKVSLKTPFRDHLFVLADSSFKFRVQDVKQQVYVSLYIKQSNNRKQRNKAYGESNSLLEPLIRMYLAEPGDRIEVVINRIHSSVAELMFSGVKSGKYKCQYSLDSNSIQQSLKNSKSNTKDSSFYFQVADKKAGSKSSIRNIRGIESWFDQFDKNLHQQLEILERNRTSMGAAAYRILKSDLIASNWMIKTRMLLNYYLQFKSLLSSDDSAKVALEMNKISKVYETNLSYKLVLENPDLNLASRSYLDLLVDAGVKDNIFLNQGKKYGDYSIIRSGSAEIREKALIAYFYGRDNHIIDTDSLISDAMTLLRSKSYKSILDKFSREWGIGKKAYVFSLSDQNGKTISLSDFLGKTVVIDVWYTGCIGCSTFYLNSLRYAEHYFQSAQDVVFLIINADLKTEDWIKSINSGIYTSMDTLNIINLNTRGLGLSHPVIEQYGIAEYPHPLIIDNKGNFYSRDRATLRNKDELIRTIERARKKAL